jgi:hypothetical protein
METQVIKLEWKWSHTFVALSLILLAAGCGGRVIVSPASRPAVSERRLARMGYSIQIGAFSNLDNAVRLTESLDSHGLNAYYFVHKTGLYKVRFGDFLSKETARRKADSILAAGIIDGYYIVSPDDYAVVKEGMNGRRYLRDRIVQTAQSYIGLPYRWGGSSSVHGFDCSGFAMTIYQLNGLKLPRSSEQQYRAGIPVKRSRLSRGDLVFFATSTGRKISHVGVYAGDNRFIHAPGRGKRIRADSLSNRYFETRYAGARTYLW